MIIILKKMRIYLKEKKTCYIIPLKTINKLKLLGKNSEGKYMDLNLFLKPITSDSDYYVIQNKNGQYLRGKENYTI